MTDAFLYLAQLKGSRARLDNARARLEWLEANPASVPASQFDVVCTGGYHSDRTASNALRNLRMRERCKRDIGESLVLLRGFKSTLERSNLNDLARACLWARHGMQLSWREIGKRLRMDTVHAHMLGTEALQAIIGDLERA